MDGSTEQHSISGYQGTSRISSGCLGTHRARKECTGPVTCSVGCQMP
jgi:hypothetical protein